MITSYKKFNEQYTYSQYTNYKKELQLLTNEDDIYIFINDLDPEYFKLLSEISDLKLQKKLLIRFIENINADNLYWIYKFISEENYINDVLDLFWKKTKNILTKKDIFEIYDLTTSNTFKYYLYMYFLSMNYNLFNFDNMDNGSNYNKSDSILIKREILLNNKNLDNYYKFAKSRIIYLIQKYKQTTFIQNRPSNLFDLIEEIKDPDLLDNILENIPNLKENNITILKYAIRSCNIDVVKHIKNYLQSLNISTEISNKEIIKTLKSWLISSWKLKETFKKEVVELFSETNQEITFSHYLEINKSKILKEKEIPIEDWIFTKELFTKLKKSSPSAEFKQLVGLMNSFNNKEVWNKIGEYLKSIGLLERYSSFIIVKFLKEKDIKQENIDWLFENVINKYNINFDYVIDELIKKYKSLSFEFNYIFRSEMRKIYKDILSKSLDSDTAYFDKVQKYLNDEYKEKYDYLINANKFDLI